MTAVLLNTVVASEAFVFLWLSTFLHSEKSFEIIFIDGWMPQLDIEKSLS